MVDPIITRKKVGRSWVVRSRVATGSSTYTTPDYAEAVALERRLLRGVNAPHPGTATPCDECDALSGWLTGCGKPGDHDYEPGRIVKCVCERKPDEGI